MNDISVKIVESPKADVAEESPVLEPGEAEVDPLALEDDIKVTDTSPEQKPAICDENAKEESLEVKDEEVSEIVELEVENVKEEIPKEETSTTNGDISSEPETKPIESIVLDSPVLATNEEPAEEPKNKSEPIIVAEEEPPAPTPEIEKPIKAETVAESSNKDEEPPVKVESPVKSPSPEPVVPIPMEVAVVKVEKPATPEPSPPKAADVEMTEVPPAVEEKVPVADPVVIKVEENKEAEIEKKTELKDIKPSKEMTPVNGDVSKDDQATKRRASEEVETDSPLKKLCQEVEKTFPQNDMMMNDYIQTATKNNIDEIQRHTEQLLSEIQTLREVAAKKEHEWNNILHLKKVKEEILLRLIRRKQVLSFEKSADVNGSDRTDLFDYLNQTKSLAIDKSDEISGLVLKHPGSTGTPMIQAPMMPVTTHFNPMSGLPPPYDKATHMQSMPKPIYPQPMMMPGPMPMYPRDMNGQLPSNFNLPMGRQGPTKDVKSIIADYRQRNPEVTPRRGRRMKSILNPNMMNTPRPIAPKVDALNNISNLNMLFNNMDMNQKAMLERLQQLQCGSLQNHMFKDALIQYANAQQQGMIPNRPLEAMTNRTEHKERRRERNHEEHKPERMPSTSPRLPPPPPYPEISLLPVTTSQETTQQNSLLHGILTKNCGEITITPVQPVPVAPPPEPQPEKPEEVVQLDDEESAASDGEAAGSPTSGRLVIDEGAAQANHVGAAAAEAEVEPGAEADTEGETPLCQGCRRRDAQFVCAGCANQWYCSRDCQVAAWDDHSEMCSG